MSWSIYATGKPADVYATLTTEAAAIDPTLASIPVEQSAAAALVYAASSHLQALMAVMPDASVSISLSGSAGISYVDADTTKLTYTNLSLSITAQ